MLKRTLCLFTKELYAYIVHIVRVGWNQKTHAATALGLNTTVPGKKKTNGNTNKSHRSRSSPAQLYNINTLCLRLLALHSYKAFFIALLSASNHRDVVHCLDLLYISNSHCDRKTKGQRTWDLVWSLDARAARQNNPIDFVVWEDKGFLSSEAGRHKAQFYQWFDCVIHWAHLSGLFNGQKTFWFPWFQTI